MLFKDITILDNNFEIKKNMYVGTAADRIVYIGKTKPNGDFGREYRGVGKLLMPGFVNSHAHSPMTLLRGYGENMNLQDWLEQKIFPFEAKLNGESVYWGTMLAMAESLRYGIVSTTDMYYFCDSMAVAVIESGAKSNISRSITNIAGEAYEEMESVKEMEKFFADYSGEGDGRIRVDMSLHAEYTSDPDTAKALAEYTKSVGANMHVHVSETKEEHEACKQKYNMTPIEYHNSNGLFETPTVAAHCVWVEGNDYVIMRKKGITVATCPVSNAKLSSGICNIPKLMANEINVAIGTDSVSSNNNLNMIEEMKAFALLQKVSSMNPKVITPREALKAATVNGARAQGRNDCGLLATGYKADLIVLDIDVPHMHPIHDLINNIVYSASGSDIVLSMVDGKVLYEDGEYKTIDIEKTIFEAERATGRILSEL